MDRPPLYGQSPSAGFEPALTAREVIDGRPDLDRGSTVMFRCTCQVAGYQPWVDVVSSTFLAPHGSIDPVCRCSSIRTYQVQRIVGPPWYCPPMPRGRGQPPRAVPSGTRFGSWEVIREIERVGYNRRFECRC